MKLPPMEFEFEINLKGSVTQQPYTGKFTYKRLSIGNQGKADVLRVRLNGDLSEIDPEVNKLHEMMAWLRYGLIEYPDWWRSNNFGEELYDTNIIVDIYTRITEFEKKWAEKVKENAKSITDSSN